MKKTNKIVCILIIFLIILSSLSTVLAFEPKTTLNVIKDSTEKIYLENDQGDIEKRITYYNSEMGELTVQLSVNNKDKTAEVTRYENTEIYFLIYEGIVSNNEKLSNYITYIETLSNEILNQNQKTKIGIIGMQGTLADYKMNEEGNRIDGENDESHLPGTVENSEIVVKLTNNVVELINGIKEMNSSKNRYYTNLQAAIRLANKSYSKDVNKILISLYDDVPTIAIGVESQISYGGILSEYSTIEEAVVGKNEKIVNRTKAEILELRRNNVDFILLRPDDTSFDQNYYNSKTGALSYSFDGSPYVKELYGTLENPTYGKMYSLNNDSLENIITNYIYKDIIEKIRIPIKDAILKDYLSEEIINNFDITVINNNIDITNLGDTGYIEWNIGEINGNSSAVLEYKLKIKDMRNSQLLNKIINISENIELSYTDSLNEKALKKVIDSPQIKLVEEEINNNNNTDTVDTTIAPGKLPDAGLSITILISAVMILICGLIIYKKYNKLKDI